MDRNIEDEWLERLNDLQVLKLINICEGHHNHQSDPSRRSPHVVLRLKEAYLSGAARLWDGHKMAILEEVDRSFQTGDTNGNLEVKFKLRWGSGRLTYQEDVVLRIRGQQRRTSAEMDDSTRAWFEQSVAGVEVLDRSLARLWEAVSESKNHP